MSKTSLLERADNLHEGLVSMMLQTLAAGAPSARRRMELARLAGRNLAMWRRLTRLAGREVRLGRLTLLADRAWHQHDLLSRAARHLVRPQGIARPAAAQPRWESPALTTSSLCVCGFSWARHLGGACPRGVAAPGYGGRFELVPDPPFLPREPAPGLQLIPSPPAPSPGPAGALASLDEPEVVRAH